MSDTTEKKPSFSWDYVDKDKQEGHRIVIIIPTTGEIRIDAPGMRAPAVLCFSKHIMSGVGLMDVPESELLADQQESG